MLLRWGSLLFILFFFIACGGDATTKESLPLKTLYFIDAPVDGIEYECGVRKFRTQAHIINGIERHGVALCRYEPVIFRLGSLVLGTMDKIKHEQEIYPQDLVGISHDNFEDENLLKLSLLLQSLDDDGEISNFITIDEKLKNKITISSLDTLSFEEVTAMIKRLGKKPRSLKEVKEHLQHYSGIPHLNDTQIEISDSVGVGEVISILNIENPQEMLNIQILEGSGKEDFIITPTGNVKVAKALDAKKQYLYQLQIQATNKRGKSNIANLTILLKSADNLDMQFIEKPIIPTKEIFTNNDNYLLTVIGREECQIFIDNINTGKQIPRGGKAILARSIPGADIIKEYSVTLGYPNGIRSEPVSFKLIKDTTPPAIRTIGNIYIDENFKIINTLSVTDSNKASGLSYTLSGEDHQYFEISNVGELSFRRPVDFEMPKDANGDNIYRLTVNVKDKAGNSSAKSIDIHIGDILDSKPTIFAFSETIATNLPVGNNIGKLIIFEGNAPIDSLSLTGKGSEYFQLDRDGTIRLIQAIHEPKIFKLTVTATNSFGSTKKEIYIHATSNNQIGKSMLANATLKIIQLNAEGEEILHITQTTMIGDFSLAKEYLKDDCFYIYEFNQGVDINTQRTNQGTYRLITKGSWIKASTQKIILSPLSEMLYDYVAYYVKHDFHNLEKKLGESARILITKDLNNDINVDAQDILIYNPIEDKEWLYKTLKDSQKYISITKKMGEGNITGYVEKLFNSRILKSFPNADDFKLIGSFVYYFDVEEGAFYIYDMNNRTNIGRLPVELPDYESIDLFNQLFTLSNEYRVSLKVDREKNLVYLTNLNQQTFIIDIQNLREPKLISKFYTDFRSKIIYQKGYDLYISAYYDFMESFIFDPYISVFDTSNIHNVTIKKEKLLNFNTIESDQGYLFDNENCEDEYQHHIIKANIDDSDKALDFYVGASSCSVEGYFYQNTLYIHNYDGDYLEIYTLDDKNAGEDLYWTDSFQSFNYIPVGDILNIENQILYTYYDNALYFIDISNLKEPKIQQKIPYYIETSFLEEGEFNWIRKNNIPTKIQNNHFLTAKEIIDLDSFILSAPYTETEDGIDMSLFDIHTPPIPNN